MSNITAANKSSRQQPYGPGAGFLKWGMPIFILVLTLAAFYPALQNKFVNWDDYKNIVENPHYRGLGWVNIRWMFTTFHMGHYQPLSWMSLGLDHVFWGLNPFGYHLTNLIVHGANAVVFYYVSLRLLSLVGAASSIRSTHALPIAAALAALFFAVHPLRVESVVWATERRDVLSGFLFLLTLLFYLKAITVGEADSRCRQWMSISLITYVLSLLSKASGTMLPLLLVALDVYPLRRLGTDSKQWLAPESRQIWREKLPFFVLGFGAGIVALVAQYEAKAIRPLEQYDIRSRIMQSVYAVGFYLWKTVLPFNLSPLYEVPLTPDPWRWSFLLSGVVVVGITVVLFIQRRTWPAILASWIVYILLLLPTAGIAQSGAQLVADRYSYLSCMVWAVLAGGGILRLWELWLNRAVDSMFVGVMVFVTLVLLGFGVCTWNQTQVWHNSERLWRHALSIDRESSYAHNNLANALADQGRLDEAILEIREVLRINPRDADGYYNLGNFLARTGRLEEAVDRFNEALRIQPDYAMASYDLGVVLAGQGRLDEAIDQFQRALKSDPGLAKAHYNLGQIFSKQGKLDEAIRNYHLALRLDAHHVRARYYLAVALVGQGNFAAAAKEFREALRLEPDLGEAHAGLARALSAQGDKEEALRHYQEAVRLLKSQSHSRNEAFSK